MDFGSKIKHAMNTFSLDEGDNPSLFRIGEDIQSLENKRKDVCARLGSLIASMVSDKELSDIKLLKLQIRSIDFKISEKKQELHRLQEKEPEEARKQGDQ